MTDPSDSPDAADDRVMTRNEVAAWLTLSLPTLMAHIRDGVIPASQIGGEWRFWRPALLTRLFPQQAPPAPDRHEHDVEVITTAQLGKLLRLTGETVRARIDDGSIPASKIGNHWRIYWPTIRARLQAGENFTPQGDPPTSPPNR